MCRWAEHFFAAEAEAEQAAFEATPEGRECLREQERELREAEQSLREQERRWARDSPLEWSAWLALRPLWNPHVVFGVDEYGFCDFLREVGAAPPGRVVSRKDEESPFAPGNVRWSVLGSRPVPDAAPAEPEYLPLKRAAKAVGLSYDFVRDAVISGDLVAAKKGTRWLVGRDDLRAWMGRGRPAAAPASKRELAAKVSRYLPGLSG